MMKKTTRDTSPTNTLRRFFLFAAVLLVFVALFTGVGAANENAQDLNETLNRLNPGSAVHSENTVTLLKDINITEKIIIYDDGSYPSAKNIILTSNDTCYINRSTTYALFEIQDSTSLEITGNIIVDGNSQTYTSSDPLVTLAGGTFTLSGNARLQNNHCVDDQGAVTISYGTFYMNGGTIANNSAAFHGCGVRVSGGEFSMTGGTIMQNQYEGVWVTGGTFTMDDGLITNNGNYGISLGNGITTINGGTISDHMHGVYVQESSSSDSYFNLNGGNIINNQYEGVYVGGGDVTMTGGTISQSQSGIGLYSNPGHFTMSGGCISDNSGYGVFLSASGNVESSFSDNITFRNNPSGDISPTGTNIIFTGNITSDTMISLKPVDETDNVIIATATTEAIANSVLPRLTLLSSDQLSLKVNGTDIVILSTESSGTDSTIHTHNDSIEWTAWSSTTSLPNTAGSYYLTENVKLNATWTVSGSVDLCLNGHVIEQKAANCSVITVPQGATLNMYDCGATQHYFVEDGNMYYQRISYTVPDTDNYYGITGGVITGARFAGFKDGGGICIDGGTVNMYGGNVVANHETDSLSGGSGVYVSNGGNFNMYGGTLALNAATSGGGTYLENGTFNLYDGAICWNHAATGGGVFIGTDSSFDMSGGFIEGNSASEGGGVNVFSSIFNMTGGYIVANNASNGGGIFSSGHFNLYDGLIEENEARDGAGVALYESTFNMVGGGINLNTADWRGGGVDIYNSTFVLIGGTISQNTAVNSGAGVYLNSGSNLTMNGAAVINETNELYLEQDNTIIINGDSFTGSVKNITGTSIYSGVELVNVTSTTLKASEIIDQFALKSTHTGLTLANSTDDRTITIVEASAIPPSSGTNSTKHSHDDGIEWTAWSSTTSLPTTGGCYYLTDDVTLSSTWELSDKVELCLNGHVIRMADNTKDVARVVGTLRIYDCGNTEHYFTVNQTSGLWEPSETQTSETKVVTGGIITGGKNGIWVPTGTLELHGGNIIGNAGSGLYVYDSESVTIFDGTIAGNAGAFYGGGVYLDNSHLTMSGGNITDNTIVYRGGGILVSENSTFTMTGGVIARNTASEGGGGISVERNATMVMTNGRLSENVVPYSVSENGGVSGGAGGGGIYLWINGTVIMDGGEIVGNSAAFGGGVEVHGDSTFTMNSGVIENNTAVYNAGIDSMGVTITINGGTITKNTAMEIGGGVHVQDGFLIINSGTIANNVAVNGTAGGIYVYNSTVTMTGGTVTGNTASGVGDGVYLYNSPVTLSGSAAVNADNEVYFNSGSNITVTGDTFNGGFKNLTSSSTMIVDGQTVVLIDSETLTASAIQNQFGLHSKHSTSTLSPTADNKALAVTVTLADAQITVNDLIVSPAVNEWNYTYAADQQHTVTVTVNGSITGYGTITVKYNDNENAPVAAGIYNVTASVSGGENYSAGEVFLGSLIINKLMVADPTFTNQTFTYDGMVKTFSVAEDTNYTVTGNTATAAGNYTATVTLIDIVNTTWSDGSIDALTYPWSIGKQSIAVPTATNTTLTYDGTAKDAPITVDAVNCTITANASAVAAGNYVSIIQLTDATNTSWEDNTEGNKEIAWTIAPKSIEGLTVTLAESTYAYSGETFQPQVTITDNGTTLAETDFEISGDISNATAGDHVITIIGQNNYTGQQTATWNITKAVPTAELFTTSPTLPASYEYNGNAYEVTVSAEGVAGLGDINVTYNGSETAPTEKGSYLVNVSIAEGANYIAADINLGTLTITGRLIPVPVAGAQLTYSGQSQAAPIAADDTNYTITTNASAVAAGTYLSILKLKDTVNTSWQGGSTEDITVEWTINSKSIAGAKVTFDDEGYTYDGNEFTPSITVTDGATEISTNDYEVSGDTSNATAGEHIVTVTGKGNYTGSVTGEWNIEKATPTKDNLTITPADAPSYTANGTAYSVQIAAADGIYGLGEITVKYNGATDAPSAAGVYKVNASIAEGVNYTAAEDIYIYDLTILTMPSVDAKTVQYKAHNSTVVDIKFNLTNDWNATDVTIEVKSVDNTVQKTTGKVEAGEGATVRFTGLQAGTAYTVNITPQNVDVGGTENVYTGTFTTPTITSVELSGLPSSGVIDLNGVHEGTLTAAVKDEKGNVLADEAITWGSTNTSVLTIDNTGKYKAKTEGTTTVSVTAAGNTTAKVTKAITVINTTAVQPELPIEEPTKDTTTGNTTITGETATPTLSTDGKTATLEDSASGVTMTVTFEKAAEVDTTNKSIEGKVTTVLAEYEKASAAPSENMTGAVDVKLNLTLKDVTTKLPKMNTTINTTVQTAVTAKDKQLMPVAMITAETNVGSINSNISGDGIEISFIVPTEWVTAMKEIWWFHAEGSVTHELKKIDKGTIKDNNDDTSTIIIRGSTFSTYGIAGKMTETQTPPENKPTQGSSSGSSGTSTWLPMQSETPVEPTEQPTPTETPTDSVSTDIPGTQPTATPASPGFGMLAALAGLGAVAVMRRQ